MRMKKEDEKDHILREIEEIEIAKQQLKEKPVQNKMYSYFTENYTKLKKEL